MIRIKYLAVLVSGIFYFLLGGLWYSPLLFEKKFIELMNYTPQQLAAVAAASHAREMIIAFIISIISAYALAFFVEYSGARTALAGAWIGILAWIGFVMATNLSTAIFEDRPMGLFLINGAYHLVALAVIGIILAVWRVPDSPDYS